MKKSAVLMAMVVCAAAAAYADIGVDWRNTGFMWYDKNGNGVLDRFSTEVPTLGQDEYQKTQSSPFVTTLPAYVQLLWSASKPADGSNVPYDPLVVVGEVGVGDLAGKKYVRPWGDEYLLASYTTDGLPATPNGPHPSGLQETYGRFDHRNDAPVAKSEFADSLVGNIDINTGYLYSRLFSDQNLNAATRYYQSPFVNNLPELDPQLPQSVIAHDSAAGGSSAGGRGASDRQYNYEMVPEPSTMALLGLGVATLVLRRRIR